MLCSGQLQPCLRSPPQHSRAPHRGVSGSYHADTDRRRWPSDRSLQALQAGPGDVSRWRQHFSDLHQISGIPLSQAYWQNIRKLPPRLRSHTGRVPGSP